MSEGPQEMTNVLVNLLGRETHWALMVVVDGGAQLYSSGDVAEEYFKKLGVAMTLGMKPAEEKELVEPCFSPMSGVGCPIPGCTHGIT